jgi:hypothetical protein
MATYRSIGYLRIISVATTVLLLSSLSALAADTFVGNIRAIDSTDPALTAKIVRLGYAGILSGKPGDAVFIGDTVKTAEGVRVQLVLSDNSIITIAPNSAVQLKGYIVDRDRGKRNSVLRSMKGTVRFVIAKFFKPQDGGTEKKWKESNVTIEAQNVVAGVRGTDLAVSTGESETEIAVFDGAVNVRHSSPFHKGAVTVGADQLSQVKKDSSPGQPEALSQQRRDALMKATTLVNPRTTAEAPNKVAAKKKKYDDKDIAQDLAAGVSLADVLDKAVDSGMPLDQVVVAALDAGVAPSILIYTAVIEGYSVKQVVTAAVEHGVPLSVVAAAALGAGADKNLVISGATDAGVPKATIATAIAAATSPNAAVYGTTTPMDSTPAAIIPAPPVAIGGGGGGTPSTLPASPYRP